MGIFKSRLGSHYIKVTIGDQSIDVVLPVPTGDVLHLGDGKIAGDGAHRSGRGWERIVVGVEQIRWRSAETGEPNGHLLSHIGNVGPGEGEYAWQLCEVSRSFSQVPLIRTTSRRWWGGMVDGG